MCALLKLASRSWSDLALACLLPAGALVPPMSRDHCENSSSVYETSMTAIGAAYKVHIRWDIYDMQDKDTACLIADQIAVTCVAPFTIGNNLVWFMPLASPPKLCY